MGRKENEASVDVLRTLAGWWKCARVQCGKWQTMRGHWMAGAPTGWSDYIGWRSVVITPEMVGTRCAIFCAIEMKQPGKKRTDEQINFQRVVAEDGGIAACCDGEESARMLMENNA